MEVVNPDLRKNKPQLLHREGYYAKESCEVFAVRAVALLPRGLSPGEKDPDRFRAFSLVAGGSGRWKTGLQAVSVYFGRKLQGNGIKPLNPKSVPTAIGWSDLTLTVLDTLVIPSNPGPLVVGVCQVKFSVCSDTRATVVAPV